MIIKVSGMRDADNIRAIKELGIDMLGLVFYPKSQRYVSSVPVHAGIIPDWADTAVAESTSENKGKGNASERKRPAIVGVFVNEMPQTVITHAYNYRLDYLQLHGDETPIYIDNLRRTLVPDLLPNVKIIKAITIREAEDVKRWREYEGHADLLLFDTKCKTMGGSGEQFDWSVLEQYDGDIPFLLSGGIGPEDAERLKAFKHPKFVGIDINSHFEDAPAIKNKEKIRQFLSAIRQ